MHGGARVSSCGGNRNAARAPRCNVRRARGGKSSSPQGTSSSLYTRRILSCVHFSSSRAAVAGCASKNARRGARDAPRATRPLY